MPALRPTPTTAYLVQRQPLDIGGVAQDAGAGIGGAAQSGMAGAGGVAATVASGAGGAIETVANAPNAAMSAGAKAAGDKIVDDAFAKFKEKYLVATVVSICIFLVLMLALWRYIRMRKRERTFWRGRPKGEALGGGGGKDGYNEKD